MKLVILGVGGMGAITLSKMIAQMSMDRDLSVKSSEIHGMAKKGGLVEVQMKINEGTSGVVLQHEADISIVFRREFKEYASAFLKQDGRLIVFEDKVINDFVKEFKDIRYISSFALGVFVKHQDIFTKEDAYKVIGGLKNRDLNLKAFEKGVEYDF
ncbi:2-oxoacid:acceptor oxidoreductase family protein [Hippea alviniae]|uniref:2-oxoacid:acceptor oxidoreductase family protein n=1 Tax=Hippea alviniae TaxID=1279027 RepID=UPI0003B58503|nr:2-oxoacid:acceptor oxidoreductase family protein [Hippea alviniae]